jgi:hypothetical protein
VHVQNRKVVRKLLVWLGALSAAASAQTLFGEAALPELPPARAQWIDVNRDGFLDICLVDPSRKQPRVWLRGAEAYVERPDLLVGSASFLCWGDLNADGLLDCLGLTQGGPAHSRWLGQEDGTFVRSEFAPSGNTLSAALADLDLDGALDLVLAHAYADESQGYAAQPMRVLRGPDFEDVTTAWGMTQKGPPGAAGAARPLYGVSASDLNNDGYPEVLGAAYGRQWNTLWMRGPHSPDYFDVAAKYGLDGDASRHGLYSAAVKERFRVRTGKARVDELPFRSNGNTFALAPADFDSDGDIDVFSAEITHAWAGDSSDLSTLLVNRWDSSGEPFLERCLENVADPQTGLPWRPSRGLHRDHQPQTVEGWNQGDLQAHWADLDQDGRLDVLVCESDYPHNRLRVFLQKTPGKFAECASELGLLWPNCPGLALGDEDRDGDLDLLTLGTRNRWPEARPVERLALWRNQSLGASLWVRLVGSNSNTDAIGARLTLETDQGRQCREMQGPYGHWAQQTNPGEVHFGLGSARARRLKIVWPDATRSETVVDDLPDRGWVVIRQGRGMVHSSPRFDAAAWVGR